MTDIFACSFEWSGHVDDMWLVFWSVVLSYTLTRLMTPLVLRIVRNPRVAFAWQGFSSCL